MDEDSRNSFCSEGECGWQNNEESIVRVEVTKQQKLKFLQPVSTCKWGNSEKKKNETQPWELIPDEDNM